MNINIITAEELKHLTDKLNWLVSNQSEEIVTPATPVIYDNDALSAKLNVSKRTLQDWRDKGLISFSQVGQKIFYTHQDVEDFLASHRVQAFKRDFHYQGQSSPISKNRNFEMYKTKNEGLNVRK